MILYAVRKDLASLNRIDLAAAVSLPRKELMRQLEGVVGELLAENRIQLNRPEQTDLVYQIVNDMLGLGPLEAILRQRSGLLIGIALIALADVIIPQAQGKVVGLAAGTGEHHMAQIGRQGGQQALGVTAQPEQVVGDTTASMAPAWMAASRTSSTSAWVSVAKELTATTTFTPNLRAFSIC